MSRVCLTVCKRSCWQNDQEHTEHCFSLRGVPIKPVRQVPWCQAPLKRRSSPRLLSKDCWLQKPPINVFWEVWWEPKTKVCISPLVSGCSFQILVRIRMSRSAQETCRSPAPSPRDPDSVCLGWGPGICISFCDLDIGSLKPGLRQHWHSRHSPRRNQKTSFGGEIVPFPSA